MIFGPLKSSVLGSLSLLLCYPLYPLDTHSNAAIVQIAVLTHLHGGAIALPLAFGTKKSQSFKKAAYLRSQQEAIRLSQCMNSPHRIS